MPKNFLIIIDINSIAALSCAIYVILRYSYYFQATFSFQGCSIKKNQCIIFKPCSGERQNGFKSLKLKRCKFLWPSFTPCEHGCFCLKTLKHFRFKCIGRFLKIKLFLFLKTVLRTLKTSFKN